MLVSVSVPDRRVGAGWSEGVWMSVDVGESEIEEQVNQERSYILQQKHLHTNSVQSHPTAHTAPYFIIHDYTQKQTNNKSK